MDYSLLQVLLTILTWVAGFFSALYINKIKKEKERKALIGILKNELSSFQDDETIYDWNKIEESIDATGEGKFVTPHREEYIDWVLNRAILDPKKDHELVKALVNVKATITNFNLAVLMWNIGALTDFEIIKGFGTLSNKHFKEF